jgi:hypothetical protein
MAEHITELPEGVTIPDDISSLEFPPTMEPRRAATGVRWLRWLGLVAVLLVGALTAALLLRDGSTEPTEASPAGLIVQGYIDDALAANQAVPVSSALIVQGYIDEALAANRAVPETSSSALIVQGYIDEALAANRAVPETSSSALIVQGYIDEALAANQQGAVTEGVPSGSPFDAQTAPRVEQGAATESVPSGSPFDAPLS